MIAVSGSGSRYMSDSWIDWKPRIDDPSKASPSVKTLWSHAEAGIVKCCMIPGTSQNRTSTNSIFSSLMSLMMSSAVFSDTEALSFTAGCESNAVIEALSFTGPGPCTGDPTERYGCDVAQESTPC